MNVNLPRIRNLNLTERIMNGICVEPMSRPLTCITITVFTCVFFGCGGKPTDVDARSAKQHMLDDGAEERPPGHRAVVAENQNGPVEDPEAYEIANEAINQWCARRLRMNSMPDKLILLPTTCEVPFSILDDFHGKDQLRTLITAFRDANSEAPPWSAALNPKPRHEIVEEPKLGALMRDGGWSAVEAKWPGARFVIDVSRPGISADGKTALIYIQSGQRVWSGSGALLLLSKGADGMWVTEQLVYFVH